MKKIFNVLEGLSFILALWAAGSLDQNLVSYGTGAMVLCLSVTSMFLCYVGGSHE